MDEQKISCRCNRIPKTCSDLSKWRASTKRRRDRPVANAKEPQANEGDTRPNRSAGDGRTGKLVVRFNDQSTMNIKTAGIAGIFPPGGTIKAIQEDGTEFSVQFEDDSMITVELADPGASVAVRNQNNEWSISDDL